MGVNAEFGSGWNEVQKKAKMIKGCAVMNKIFNQHENIIWGINVRVINRNSYIFHILLPLSIFIWQKFRQYYVVKPKLFQIWQNWQQSKPTLEMLTHWTPSILPSNEVSFGLFLSFYHIYIISKILTLTMFIHTHTHK